MGTDIPADLYALIGGAINKYSNGKKDIKDYSVEVETNNVKGEGFLGDILFVSLTEKDGGEKQKFIIKQEKFVNGEEIELSKDLFNNEIWFYNSVWPFFQQFYEENTGKTLDFVPNCWNTSENGLKRIVLEDLRQFGYVTRDKTEPFDEKHFRKIFEVYGLFHSISFALREKENEEFRRLVDPLECIWKETFKDGQISATIMVDFIKEICSFFDKDKEKSLLEILKFYEQEGPRLIRDILDQDKYQGVILHGDCWSNNMMFKYVEDSTIEYIKLLDFQMTCGSSPAFDIAYCFYSGGSGETFEKLEYYLRIYHNSLSETLDAFGLDVQKVYTFETLKSDWKKYSKFGFVAAVTIWRLKLADKNFIPEVPNATNSRLEVIKLAEDKKELYKKIMRDLVLHFQKHDFF